MRMHATIALTCALDFLCTVVCVRACVRSYKSMDVHVPTHVHAHGLYARLHTWQVGKLKALMQEKAVRLSEMLEWIDSWVLIFFYEIQQVLL